jgi:hypothetical protein
MKTTDRDVTSVRAVIAGVVGVVAGAAALLQPAAALGQNQIANPGFELGNTGFGSDYSFSGGGNCCEGQYTVRGNGSTFNGSFVNPPPSSPGSSLMMVVNGSTVPNVRVWYQGVAVTPGTRYRLSLRGCTAVAGGPAILRWQVDGTLVGDPVSLPTVTREWVDVRATWTAPLGTTSIALAVRNLNTATFPNDFYIDDLAMIPTCVGDVDDGSGTGTPDGGVTIEDLLYYLTIFEQGALAADVDDGSGTGTPDGGVTIDDLLFFLVRFENGC